MDMRFEKMQVSGYVWETFLAKGGRLAPDATSIQQSRIVQKHGLIFVIIFVIMIIFDNYFNVFLS